MMMMGGAKTRNEINVRRFYWAWLLKHHEKIVNG